MPIVAIISKPQKPELIETIPSLFKWLRERGCEVVADRETISYLRDGKAVKREEMPSYNPQFAIVLGGDGTLLAAARVFAQSCVPILGVNLGSLGFLTEVSLSELYENLQAAINGSCELESRTMLCCQLRRGGQLLSEHDAKPPAEPLKNLEFFMPESEIQELAFDESGRWPKCERGSGANSLRQCP